MAFFSKIRGVLQQSITKNMGGEISASTPAIFQAFRCMSSKIFVGGLSYQTTEDTLRQTCEKYGAVHDAKIIYDRETGNSRGFAFITYESDEAANSAIMALDSQELDGRRLKVNHAHDRAQTFGRGGGVNFGGGNFGGGGGGYNNFGSGGGYNNNYGNDPNQGSGGYNQGGSGGYNQSSGGYDNQAGGGYNVQGNQGGSYGLGSYPSTDLGGNNAGNFSFGVGNNQNYGVPTGGDNFNVGSVDNAPGLSYGGGDQSVNSGNSDFPFDGEDGQQERRAS